MARFRTQEVVARSGLPLSTAWRRIVRLMADGALVRSGRTGGAYGSESWIDYSGSLDELVSRLRKPRKLEGFIANRCPTCGHATTSIPDGPSCPLCGQATERRGGGLVWCLGCRQGFLKPQGPKPRATPNAGS